MKTIRSNLPMQELQTGRRARYFFDSQPTETRCGKCEGAVKLVREITERDATAVTDATKKQKAA